MVSLVNWISDALSQGYTALQSLVKRLVSMVWHGRPLAVFWCAEALYHRSHMLLGVTILDHECEASKTGLSKQTKSKGYSAKQRLLAAWQHHASQCVQS